MKPTLDSFNEEFIAIAQEFFPMVYKKVESGDWESWSTLCLLASAYSLGICDGMDNEREIWLGNL